MSRSTASRPFPGARLPGAGLSGARVSGTDLVRRLSLPWALVGAAVLVQICYPLVPDGARASATVVSVLVFCAASVSDAARVHGLRGVGILLAVAGGGGLAVEAVGVRTGVPFGTYAYTGDLGAMVLGVPAVVPLAWTMMAWPALVVGRTLHRRWPAVPVALVGGVALAAWDLFLDPQMVDAGYWTWAHPHPALPLVPGVPVTNYAGWLLVAVVMVGLLHRVLPSATRPSGPAAALYLWTYGSSVLAHVVFFDRPGSALVGGIAMGALALPFARALWSSSPARPLFRSTRRRRQSA
jgi:putative membrane protein